MVAISSRARRLALAAGLACLSIDLVCAAPDAVGDFRFDARTEAAKGARGPEVIDFTLHRKASPAQQLHLIVGFIPREHAAISVRAVGRPGDAETLMAQAGCPPGDLVLNGGFYIRDEKGSRPLGLVRVKGETLSRPSGRRFGGFLTADGSRGAILRRGEVARAMAADYAVESSPLVVEGGQNGIRSDDKVVFDRTGVGVARDGGMLVVGVFGANQETVTLREFGDLAIAGAARLGHQAVDVLAMDGGPSAHIRVGETGALYGYRGPAFLPNAVCVGRR